MTSETVSLSASDGHQLHAYVAHPDDTPRGGLIVLQEIFGVNPHMRKVADSFAAAGYLAVAPALFDRIEANIELGYDNFDAARAYLEKMDRDACVKDMAAAADYARSAGKVGAVGYCWGGSMADLAACHGLVDAAVSYYGRMTVDWLDLQPTCPVLYHYGERDSLIPMQTIEQIARKRDGEVRVWGGADHGFNCDERPSFNKKVAEQARVLTLQHFATHL